ncbi:arginyltransferase 1 isoform X2 [Rhodnius prolixus]|uniref:Arginyl-tRNA--protein transferase 1 n=1 Tax=Rhodnius prolixus TaxID=13249 RepID=A0A4P6D8F6_RHOPR
MNIYSQVEYMSSHEGYSCGYCKSPNTNFSHGMWAHVLSVNDYQNLIDRGWRRSGMYCYKPTMSITCCPLYTIRCEATHLKLTKSQKKILKKMTKFLKDGLRDNKNDEPTDDSEALGEVEGENVCEAALLERVVDKFKMSETKIANFDESVSSKKPEGDLLPKDITISQVSNSSVGCCDTNISSSSAESNKDSPRLKTPRPGDGMDPSKPQCKKAKILRLERKQKKNQQKENSMEICKNVKQSKEKSIEDWIKESVDNSSANKLELRLVNSNPVSPEFEATFEESHSLYVKYQMAIHKDPPSKCTKKGYIRFLIRSPLEPYKDENGPPSGYGSFHQQYWLNGKLIAVGVIDILPKCVSSVYFFYDPDYSFLSLGTYGSLRELELVRSYAEKCPDLKYYYMGFYIHSCPKMRYKAKLTPSYLLCPEVYTWCSIEKCIPKLDASKYSRLNDDNSAVCRNSNISLNQVLILYNRIAMTYNVYKSKTRSNDEEEIKEYAELVGSYSSQNMLLLRH